MSWDLAERLATGVGLHSVEGVASTRSDVSETATPTTAPHVHETDFSAEEFPQGDDIHSPSAKEGTSDDDSVPDACSVGNDESDIVVPELGEEAWGSDME